MSPASLTALHLEDADVQHSRLRQYVAALDGQVRRGARPETMLSILADLVAYTALHFADEEQFMQSAGCDGLEEHAAAHNRLLAEVRQLESAVRNGRAVVTAGTVDWLRRWLEDHTATLDARYVNAVAGRGTD